MSEPAVQKEPEITLDSFYILVNQIRAKFRIVDQNMATIQDTLNVALTQASLEKSEEHAKSLNALLKSTKKELNTLGETLKIIGTENDRLKEEAHCTNNEDLPDELRTRVTVHNTYSKKFVAILSNFQKLQFTTESKIKERTKRLLQMVQPDISIEALDKVVETGDVQSVLRQQMAGSDSVVAYQLAKERHADILELAQSIQELHQMALDFAVLLQESSEKIDDIAANVSMAKQYVKDASQDLTKAIKHQKKGRKLQCILLIIFVVIVIIVLASVLPSVLKH